MHTLANERLSTNGETDFHACLFMSGLEVFAKKPSKNRQNNTQQETTAIFAYICDSGMRGHASRNELFSQELTIVTGSLADAYIEKLGVTKADLLHILKDRQTIHKYIKSIVHKFMDNSYIGHNIGCVYIMLQCHIYR